MGESNWAGTYTYRAARVHRPSSLDELRRLVAAAPRIRALGSRHSFSDIADSDELVSLDALPADVEVDREAGTVSFNAGLRYAALAEALRPHGLALHNLASLPHISVAGAVATGTHGSGDRSGSLATAVAALELVTSDGELLRVRRGDRDFDGMVVGLGALGVVVRLTLDVEPGYQVRQRVYEGLGWDALHAHLDEITSAGDSVSVFTRWGEEAGQVWVKTRLADEGQPEPAPGDLFGARPASVERHPLLGLDPVNCTRQLGVAGSWSERLPHFRSGFTPSRGDELQSEYLLPRGRAREAIDALRALGPALHPLLLVCELRTVAADALWMSGAQGRATFALHFTWKPDLQPVLETVGLLEQALEPFEPRPHWGKVFVAGAERLVPRYPRAADFARLAARLDPRGAFRNDWLERTVLPPPALQVVVRSGGTLRDALGARRPVELPAGATVGDLLGRLAAVPGLPEGALTRAAVSVQGAIVPPGHRLSEGDEVALVLPVAGG